MVKVLIGNMFASEAQTIVNTVNCVGVMGKGVAQEFKKRFPDMFKEYSGRCSEGRVKPGIPYLYSDLFGTSIINFPTKDHWRSPSKLEDIIQGLDVFVQKYAEWGIQSIAFPPLGCGNGGLEWAVVGPLMYQKLSKLDIPVEVYAPYGTPKHHLTTEFLQQEASLDKSHAKGKAQNKLKKEWIPILEVLHQLERQPYANPVGRTIYQKICYTITEQGIDTGFKFVQGSYGPFSKEAKSALSSFSNSNLVYEEQLGSMTALKIGPEYQSFRDKHKEDVEAFTSKIYKATDLFSRIKSTKQAEEVTTVFYAMRQLKKAKKTEEISESDVYDFVLNWKKQWATEDKKEAIALAIRNLAMLSWVKVKFSESLPLSEMEF